MTQTNFITVMFLLLTLINVQAQTTTTDIQCCKGSMPGPQQWDEGGVCCGDGDWHPDRGDGATKCSDFNLEDSVACNVPPASSTDGCRAPTEFYGGVSCESCCDQNMADCIEHSGEEWYNSVRFLPNADCPSACPRCASCSIRDEESLKKLTVPPECNPSGCADMNIGIDACFARGSCECFCETANTLLEMCPQIKPDWLQLEELEGKLGCGMDTFFSLDQIESGDFTPSFNGVYMVIPKGGSDVNDITSKWSNKKGVTFKVLNSLNIYSFKTEDRGVIAMILKDESTLSVECDQKVYIDDSVPQDQNVGGAKPLTEDTTLTRPLTADQCANKGCGEVCENPCPAGVMCPTVMYYCQPDGSCGMNASPECPNTIHTTSSVTSEKKTVLSEGDICCDCPENSLKFCSSTCGDGLECVFYGKEIGAPTCKNSGELMDFVHWTVSGPWDLKAIQGEYDTLLAVFTQMLQVPPFSTSLMIQRVDGIVEVGYSLVADTQTTEKLNDPDFRFQFDQNIAQANPDLATSMFINESDVVAMFVLEGIWDIDAVEEQQENLRSHFSIVLGMDLDMVEEEITSGDGKMTEIIYKAKGNPMQIAPLYEGAKFSEDLKYHILATNPGLARILHIHAQCPQVEPSEGHMCIGSLRCEYGEECCCGSCFAETTYACYGGRWAVMENEGGCLATDCSEFPKPTAGLKLNNPEPVIQEPDNETKKFNLTHLAIILACAIVLGIFAGLLMHWISNNLEETSKDHSSNVYHDISLDSNMA